MTEITFDPAELQNVIDRMHKPSPHYDRAAELIAAGRFVADFGTLPELFQGVDLLNARTWEGHPDAAWAQLAHWSFMRGDPNVDPQDPFEHSRLCPNCQYLEEVAALRAMFEFYNCDHCGGGLQDHTIAPNAIGNALAWCNIWTRVEPLAQRAGDPGGDQQTSDAYDARWYAALDGGLFAVVTRTYYLATEVDADSRTADDVEYMFRDDDFVVCTDWKQPSDTMIAETHDCTRLDETESLDPHQLAWDSFEPEDDEWQECAPDPYRHQLIAKAATTA